MPRSGSPGSAARSWTDKTPEDSDRDRSSPPPRSESENAKRIGDADAFCASGAQPEVPGSLEIMSEVLLQAPEIHCDHCKTSIEDAVGIIDGVQSVEVAIADATVRVAYDDDRVELGSIKKAIEEQGYAVFG